MYDVLIIGGGVTGSAIARELSRYDLKTALFEKGRTSVLAPPRQTAASPMQASMRRKGEPEGENEHPGKPDDGRAFRKLDFLRETVSGALL